MAEKIDTEIKNDQMANILQKDPKVAQELSEMIKNNNHIILYIIMIAKCILYF